MVLVVSDNVEDKGKQYCEVSEESRRTLLQPQSSAEYRNIKPIERTGTIWTGIAHIITAVIGAGVLSLAWSIGQLGWIGGPIVLLAFSVISLISSFLVSECYRSYLPLPLPKMMIKSAELLDELEDDHHHLRNLAIINMNMKGGAEPEPEEDKISVCNASYIQAVTRLLGETQGKICGVIVHQSLYGAAIAYTITAGLSIRAIEQANCYHRDGREATCSYTYNYHMLAFGGVQVVMCQIPTFHKMEWLSILAAAMSFTYASIGLGLGLATVIENGTVKGGISGMSASSTAEKLYLMFQAIGDIAYAYCFSLLVLEIQDTLKGGGGEEEQQQQESSTITMKKASTVSVFIMNIFYLFCGCFGYAAFGDSTAGNLLTGFGFYEPYWLLDFANACVVLHLVGGYQVYSQPVFAFVEGWLGDSFPTSGFVHDSYDITLAIIPTPIQMNLLRLCFRTVYVASTTAVAMSFPYFNEVLGVLGSLYFWPITVYYPVEMYIKNKGVRGWSTQGLLLRSVSLVLFAVGIAAFVGSVQGLFSAAKFKMVEAADHYSM